MLKVATIIICCVLPLLAQSIGVVSDNTMKPADYNTFNPPEAVQSRYTDPAFGTEIRRITSNHQYLNSGHVVLGGYFANSEICYFNKDGTYFIACENDYINGNFKIVLYLYNGITGERLKFLGFYGELWRPFTIRWALGNYYTQNGQKVYFDPNTHFYQYYQNEVRLYNINQPENYVLLHEFDEYSAIGPAGGEGDISDNGRYWILDGDEQEFFVYDLLDDIKFQPSTFNLGSLGSKGGLPGADYAAISAGGNYALVAWGTDPGVGKRFAGIELYDKNFNFIRQLHPGVIHWETGIDVNGDEVIFSVATFESPSYWTPAGAKPGDLVSIRCSDGRILLLKSVPSWAHVMFSFANFDSEEKYLYASYMERSENPSTLWAPFWGEILEIPTDGSQRVRRLAHTRSHFVANQSTKYYQPDIVVNHQGTRMIYRSTYNFGAGDLYMFDILPRDATQDDKLPPNPARNLRSNLIGQDRIGLLWDAPMTASDGDVATFYKIFRDGAFVLDVFTNSFVDSLLQESESHQYSIYAVDDFGNESTPISQTFSTTADTQPPRPVYAALHGSNKIRIVFSEALYPNSITSAANYQFDQNVTVSSATLFNAKTVVLQCANLQSGKRYTITLNNIKDNSANKNTILPQTTVSFKILSLIYDDFENGLQPSSWSFRDAGNWQTISDNLEKRLALVNTDYRTDETKQIGEWALITDSNTVGSNYALYCDVKSVENLTTNPNADYALVFGYQDQFNHCYIQFQPHDVRLNQIMEGDRITFRTYSTENIFNDFQYIQLFVQSRVVTLLVDGVQVLQYEMPLLLPGSAGVGSYNDAAYFDNINFGSLSDDTQAPNKPGGLKLENP